MRSPRFLGAAGSLVFAVTLSGCVAAAIPVVAGGALLRTSTQGDVSVENIPDNPSPGPLAQSAQGLPGDADPIFAAFSPGAQSAGEDSEDEYTEFLSFALTSAMTLSGEGAASSALLADPASLSDELKPCPAGPPAVLIDLDPPGAVLPSEPVLTANAALSERLAELRRADIAIAWISGQSAAHAGAVREALASSGLDPEGRDTLLLMRYPGDRKQTRREDLAKTACLIAIAGDEREDFDELYAYLVDLEAALRLERLIDETWFLVPPFYPSDQRPTP